MEQTSIKRLNQLHPKVRQSALDAYADAVKATPKGVHPFITQTLRTFAESDALYAQGRTKPGSIVTKAKAGQSLHNYALALDFVIQRGDEARMDWNVNKDWMTVVNIFKKHGWSWGGDWNSFKDYPHLEKTLGHTWQDLLIKVNKGEVDEYGYVII